jgi:itaconyl-CoA hydratase
MAGLYFEEFSEGQVFEHAVTRTVTEMDNVLFTTLTMNPQPLHLDAEFARTTEFGRPLVNSCLTLAIVTGMSVSDTSQKAIANLGWKEVRLTAPVFVGDTLYAESEVLEKRPSQSRPEQGVVTIRTTGRKADGTAVISFERSMLMPKRPADEGDAR